MHGEKLTAHEYLPDISKKRFKKQGFMRRLTKGGKNVEKEACLWQIIVIR